MRFLTAAPNVEDAHGTWCVWCTKYFAPGEAKQLHHFLPSTYVSHFSSMGIEWTVTTHTDCEQGGTSVRDLEAISRAVGTFLLTRAAEPIDLERIDRDASIYHDRGLYPIASVLKEYRLSALARLGIGGDYLDALDRWLASRTGALLPSGFSPKELIRELKRRTTNQAVGRASTCFYLSSLASTVGEYTLAESLWSQGERLRQALKRHRKREELHLDARIRKGQLGSVADAHDAAEIARVECLPYRENTAILTEGIMRRRLNRGGFMDCFVALQARAATASWLYQADVKFELGAQFASADPSHAYQLLTEAAFIYTLLGLQPTQHPYLAGLRLATPNEVLRTFTELATLPKETCEHIRQDALLGGSLQRNLLRDVIGPAPAGPTVTASRGAAASQSRVLVLGEDTVEFARLGRIRERLEHHGYSVVIAKELPDKPHQDVRQKVLELALGGAFVLCEFSFAAGQILELDRLTTLNVITAVLREEGRGATHMLDDVPGGTSRFVQQFTYAKLSDLNQAVDRAITWCEKKRKAVAKLLSNRYHWRGSS